MQTQNERLSLWLLGIRTNARVNIYEAESRIVEKVRGLRKKLETRSPDAISMKWLYEQFGMLWFCLREVDSRGVERRQILLKPDIEFMKAVKGSSPAPAPTPLKESEIPPELVPTLE